MAEVLELTCCVQKYAWGKIGTDSAVAQLAAASDDFKVEEGSPYAELWMGAHPKAPAIVHTSEGKEDIRDWLSKNPAALGARVASAFNNKIPFLFKVLSVNKGLSIQAHPDKTLAEQLHAKDPEHYPDDNHKPEMTIALTPFKGMCGFRPHNEIQAFLQSEPEFAVVVGAEVAQRYIALGESADDAALQAALKECFTSTMKQDSLVVKTQVEIITSRVSKLPADSLSAEHSLVLTLNSQFPGGDVGCFCVFFLNIVNLSPGDAMFLGPNEPHAYLDGNCIECMACSDNVVRAGCTPKFKDVSTLCDMLTYNVAPAKSKLFATDPSSTTSLTIYNPPVPDFAVSRWKLAAGESETSASDSLSIVLIISGSCQLGFKGPKGMQTIDAATGNTYLVPADLALTATAKDEGLLMFQAYC